MAVTLHRAPVAEIDPLTLYRILWLRVTVFVVEQQAAYPEIDGRDIEPGAELLWASEGDTVLATLRVLREPGNTRIGRVATAPDARGRGIAADLMREAIQVLDAEAPGIPILLDAQAHLASWYGRFGFVVSGEPFAEDGIPHLPMRRTRLSTARLVLREWTRDDRDRAFLFDMYRRPEVRRWLGDGRVMTDEAEVDALLDRWTGLADGILGVRAVETADGAPLGSVLLKRIPWSASVCDGHPDDIEIGWHFHPDAWGSGYATEAAAAVLALARKHGIHRIVAVTNPANAVSGAVAERIGLRAVGETGAYYDTTCALYVSADGGGVPAVHG
ncbi:putative GNAT family N-acyltransferase/RimJ/RimL family protein N-acetyltransferase [Microbacterium sp. SORGH_AS 1204]|uniref:GNAT family N-acetyltransferase n=1 Tax=Microbacterium sp. SORGH_AS_1204 TaxID=3041785 RepID=UPI002790CC7A|nr:GNAT family N-acetyltransferase [Microbacterium sp. SORGH_AS_1204]MDQ1135785.1 putative GNAT family N-acyltransferase/RimJ/RimL family protein N-acetyltransferase [Microbacterium sp. SORGH_AS_1204]